MKRFRTLAVVLALTSLSSLTACGSEDAPTVAVPTGAAAPAASASASAPAPAGAATSAPASTGTSGDADAAALCKQADEAKKILVTVFAEALGGTEPDAAKVKKAVADLGAELTRIGKSGGGEAAAAMTAYGAELTKASKEADPFEASNSAASEKAGERVDAACAKA